MQQVLVIDDYEGVHTSFRMALEDAPIELLNAKDGLRGLAAIEENAVDLVYLDLRMQGMDGVETLRQLRRNNSELPVIIMTGFADAYIDELRQEAPELKFELIRKPLDMEEIYLVTAIALGGFGGSERVGAT